jgi:hypothetical protein
MISNWRVALFMYYEVPNPNTGQNTKNAELRVINLSDGSQMTYPLSQGINIGDFKEFSKNGVTKLVFYGYSENWMTMNNKSFRLLKDDPIQPQAQGYLVGFELMTKQLPVDKTPITLNPINVVGLKYQMYCGFNLEFFKSPTDNKFVLGSNCVLNDEKTTLIQNLLISLPISTSASPAQI